MESSETPEHTPDAVRLSGSVGECGVLAIDSRGRICAFNKEAGRLTKLDAEAVLGQGPEVLPEALGQLITDTAAARLGITGRLVTLATSDSEHFQVRATSTCCIAAGESCGGPGVLVVLNDLATETAFGQKVQRLDRLASIGTLSASMAHEIKNALVAVNTFVQDLAERNKDAELAGLVMRELRRIDAILSQMLRFAGPAKPTFSRVNVHRLLNHSLRLVEPQLQTKQIRLRRDFAAGRDDVTGDDYQLQQALLNIFLNAISAMEPHGELSVSTEIAADSLPTVEAQRSSRDDLLKVTIADTGPGIPAENLERLFEPFYSTKPEGTGLGLAITRRIVSEHGGKISVESEPGKGTTFRISFPLADSNG